MLANQPKSAQLSQSVSQADYLKCSQDVISALIETVSVGLFSHFPTVRGDTTDIELVLDALRALRPKVSEIESLQGVLYIVHGRWDDAVQVLRDVIQAAPSFRTRRRCSLTASRRRAIRTGVNGPMRRSPATRRLKRVR